jgi:hypothetical protein
VLIHDGDRALELERAGLGENAIEEGQHLGIRVGATAKQDDARPVRLEQGQETGVVEIRGDDDAVVDSGPLQDHAVLLGAESGCGSVEGVVAFGFEVCHCLWSDRHVDEKSQPTSSMVSSSARLAA